MADEIAKSSSFLRPPQENSLAKKVKLDRLPSELLTATFVTFIDSPSNFVSVK